MDAPGASNNAYGTLLNHSPNEPKYKFSGQHYVNHGEEDQMEIFGYRRNHVKTVLTWLLVIGTAGFLHLLFFWKPEWRLYMMFSRCSLNIATCVLLKDEYGQQFVSRIEILDYRSAKKTKSSDAEEGFELIESAPFVVPGGKGNFVPAATIKCFECCRATYWWNEVIHGFEKAQGLGDDVPVEYFLEQQGLSKDEQTKRRRLFGENSISVEVEPVFRIMIKEALNPFYIFQAFSVTVWFIDGYVYYAGAIVLISTVSIALTVHETRTQQKALRDRVHDVEVVQIMRSDGSVETVEGSCLVPGDIIIIPPHGCTMVCDAALIAGNCIVNESALTGESVPVTKTPLNSDQENEIFKIRAQARHILFSGTRVLQTRFYGNELVKAVVIRTGFMTSKGELVRSIMFPAPVDFQFYRHTYMFVGVLAAVAGCGLVYSVSLRIYRQEELKQIIIRSLDLITIAVPPALPAALTVGIVFAQRRLKQSKVFCMSPKTINISGTTNLICFDKTGTLTEDGLDFKGVVPAEDGRFDQMLESVVSLDRGPLILSMTTCHSLTLINGELSGDPLDLIMFKATGWTLEEPHTEDTSKFDLLVPTLVKPRKRHAEEEEPDEVGIVREFPFTSSLQRMSVIVKQLHVQTFQYFCKGAPEKILTLCRPETIPPDFYSKLESFTRKGDRVIALAWKDLGNVRFLKIHKLKREELEIDLHFLGFLLMENRLKPDTTQVIGVLKKAGLRPVMVTGDNIQTAISVARECGIVGLTEDIQIVTADQQKMNWAWTADMTAEDRKMLSKELARGHPDDKIHLAVAGSSFENIRKFHPEGLKKLLLEGAIFARMSPFEKEMLIDCFKDEGFFVAMCGDGANDCGALKSAHTGISLSESEAAAAAPFTYTKGSIRCVPEIIREGRAALVTSFGIFKYIACYSLTQFVSCLLLYWVKTNLADWQFLYIDMFELTILSITFGRTGAYKRIVKDPPPSSLMAFVPIFSLVMHLIIVITAQVVAFLLVQQKDWFKPRDVVLLELNATDPHHEYRSYENYTVFTVSTFQYIWLALAFAKGPPYRRLILTNAFFMATVVFFCCFDTFLTLWPTEPIKALFQLYPPEDFNFRGTIIGIAVVNLLCSLLLEIFCVDYVIFKKGGKHVKWIRSSTYLGDIEAAIRSKIDTQWWTHIEISPSKPLLATGPPSRESQAGIVGGDALIEPSPSFTSNMGGGVTMGAAAVPYLEESPVFPPDLGQQLNLLEAGVYLEPGAEFADEERSNEDRSEVIPLLDPPPLSLSRGHSREPDLMDGNHYVSGDSFLRIAESEGLLPADQLDGEESRPVGPSAGFVHPRSTSDEGAGLYQPDVKYT
ncbi:polyamine-transporting ATPase 13A3-like [Paramacrobiotus metropolitanus]|uniref:polyamine-transporting ATPase 13A3-like n=1 Tax=Paramacrobiotus metropolitanus TaxID=2943436 RepID=UPI0024461A9C|nr:polyamine-transporting ATPase 13A3-like [Paramacrobiotus metropolitanus]